jgi:hypothetical protein
MNPYQFKQMYRAFVDFKFDVNANKEHLIDRLFFNYLDHSSSYKDAIIISSFIRKHQNRE